jgi:hypothetical protein
MKRIYVLMFAVLLPLLASADEGMWLVNTFRQTIYKEMQNKGLKVKPDQFYNENAPALCDAIVAINGGMGSGSMISPEGLLITNHHVAYGDIWSLSTPEHNYLKDGFWAVKRADELPAKGTTVTFLRRVVDITAEAQAVKDSLTVANGGRWSTMSPRKQFSILEKRHADDYEGLEASCYSFFRGELYLMMYYETYNDVRLVAAPPERIGSFGGEVDNWGWPQHKADFAMYRVYVDKNGRPAEYSEDNVPLKPEKYLNISTSGISDGDYAMVIGFPGRTHRYSSAPYITEKQKVSNPIIYSCRRSRLDIIKEHMEADPNVRLKYSDTYSTVSNYMDYARWETICLRRQNVAAKRAKDGEALKEWIAADPSRTEKYGNVVDRLNAGYPARETALRNKLYYQESWFGQSVVVNIGSRVNSFVTRIRNRKLNIDSISLESDQNLRDALGRFKQTEETYDYATDKDLMRNMLEMFTTHVDRSLWGEALAEYYDRFKGDYKAMTDYIYDSSFCSSEERFKDYFSTKRAVTDVEQDPMVRLNGSISFPALRDAVTEAEKSVGANLTDDEPLYQRAMYAYRKDKGIVQYPDANSTMRVTYGTVGGIKPSDAIHYDSQSTIEGYVEKNNPDDYNFNVDDKMLNLITDKDWGRWGEKGKLYVNFLTNNDITGGNSGSPVLDARGNLIGLCFDGNRESMAGDVYFSPVYNKAVNVDIRFVLWVVDKYAGASSLLDEMTFVK